MAYFPNATSGAEYEEAFCEKCANYRLDGDFVGCPILDVHILFNHNQSGDVEEILSTLIPMKETQALECTMFLDNGE